MKLKAFSAWKNSPRFQSRAEGDIMKKYGRVYATIDLDAVEENFRLMRSGLKADTKMIAVVKTDAYGHGALQIARLV